jgi:general stress protein YciG
MPGNRTGGLKASQTNKERYGADFYAINGAKGGKKSGIKKGFALMDRERLIEVSKKGGSLGKRGKA